MSGMMDPLMYIDCPGFAFSQGVDESVVHWVPWLDIANEAHTLGYIACAWGLQARNLDEGHKISSNPRDVTCFSCLSKKRR